MGREVPGSKLFRGNYTLREFARILMQNSFYVSCFLFSVSILRTKCLRIIFRVNFHGIELSRGYLHGDGVLRGGGARFPAII